jgi:S1-C subfamily serine protease
MSSGAGMSFRSIGRAAAAAACLLALMPAPARAQLAADPGAMERRIAAAVEKAAPGVVALSVDRATEPDGAGKLLSLLRSRPDEWLSASLYRRPGQFLVSGVVVSPDGHILTSYAHVRGDLKKVAVRPASGPEVEAKLVGFDQRRDLALLQADLPGATVPAFASDPPKVGDWVVAIGRVPDPAHPTATAGIVSARKRMRGSGIQVDAELNYGNTGGALVDLEGRLVGVTCNLTERSQWGQNSGVGFAIAWDKVEDLLPRLKDGQRAAVPPQPYIGVRPAEGALDVKGVVIDEVIPGGPAAQAGLQDGDLVTRVDDKPVRKWEDLVDAIRKRKVGDTIRITVDRMGESKTLRVQVGQQDYE